MPRLLISKRAFSRPSTLSKPARVHPQHLPWPPLGGLRLAWVCWLPPVIGYVTLTFLSHLPPSPPFAFPVEVATVSNRIDAYIFSRQAQTIIAGPELTVPMEENIESQHLAKLQRYSNIKDSLAPGWSLSEVLCLEMGCR